MKAGSFVYVAKGSRIIVGDEAYEYAYAFYSLERPGQYLYTYAYQEEESWCTPLPAYSSNGFLTKDTVFGEENLPAEGERAAGENLPAEQKEAVENLLKELGRSARRFKGLKLVEVTEKSGDTVEILF